MTSSCKLLARWLFPVAAPPIPRGVATVVDGRLMEMRPYRPGEEVIDLGHAALVPGLVNAHTHLEFSSLAAPLGRPGTIFPDWIRRVVAWRRQGGHDLAAAASQGLRESLQQGVTHLGDIQSSPWPDEFEATRPPRQLRLAEFLGLTPAAAERSRQAADQWSTTATQPEGETAEPARPHRLGISPHAPYTVRPELFAHLVALAHQRQLPLAFHLAESVEELELLRSGSGPFCTLLEELGAWDPAAIPPGTRPLDYLARLTTLPRSLVIHGNYLADDEVNLLAQHGEQMSLVYCPRTHAYFGHARYPLARYLAAGVHLALGTDSRASNPDLSLWEELRYVAGHHPEVDPATVLSLGTKRAAQALGWGGSCGVLRVGQPVDLVQIALPKHEALDPHQLLFELPDAVRGVWHGHLQLGDWRQG